MGREQEKRGEGDEQRPFRASSGRAVPVTYLLSSETERREREKEGVTCT